MRHSTRKRTTRMHGWTLAALLLFAAPAARAAPFVLVFDGEVNFTFGSSPSLQALGLARGSSLHYEVLVERDADAFFVSGNGQVVPRPDTFQSPEEQQDNFYAQLVAQAYPTPGSYFDWGREFFVGADVVSASFPDCDVLGRLFVGTELFHIDGCAPVADWDVGFAVGASHIWHDPTTGESATVLSSLTVSQVMPVPEPSTALLLGLGLCGLGWRERGHVRA